MGGTRLLSLNVSPMKTINQQIKSLWDEHIVAPFPDRCRGEESEGVDLVLLDADIAGCVSTFLASGGTLDAQRQNILRDLEAEAERVVVVLKEVPERNYYVRLAKLAHLVLEECTS